MNHKDGLITQLKTNKEAVYGIMMILFLVLGIITGNIMAKQTMSVKECNEFFVPWIEENCDCSELIKEQKAQGAYRWTEQMEVPYVQENSTNR